GEADPAVLFLGERTAAAAKAVADIQAKVDDYFTRCRVGAFDPRALPLLNRSEADYVPILSGELGAAAEELASFPLAQVARERRLPLGDGVNPAHAAAVAALRTAAVAPMLGAQATLGESEWRAMKDRLAPHAAWLAAQQGTVVAGLGIARVRE